MAGVALIGAVDVGYRLGGRFNTTSGHMTAFTTPRGTMKLATYVAALTGNKIVRSKEIKAGRRMIKWLGLLVLCCRDAAP